MDSMKVAFVDEMLSDMASGIYDFTEDGKCSNCGACCSDLLPVTAKEIKTIRRYMEEHGIKEQKHFMPTAQPIAIDLVCPFRNNQERKCMIYKVRPLICREWQCNKPRDGIGASAEIFKEPRLPISMRQTFFMKGGAENGMQTNEAGL